MCEKSLNNERKKIIFFSQGDDNFINGIIEKLSVHHETKKVIIKRDMKFIYQWMEWADICWFEWCDELLIYASKLEIAKEKKIICRLHSYEAFTYYPSKVNWDCVDKLVFVSEDIQKYVLEHYKINKEITITIPNGVDLSKWTFKQRNHGFNIAYVGYINYKKGPMLLLHAIKAIFDQDNRYKFYIAGQFQNPRYFLYFEQMVKEFGLENNYFFEGWQQNLDEWLEDKNFVLCTSVLESQNMSVMQAMAKGIKPIVHCFVGAKNIYDKKYLWNTIDEAVHMITDELYESKDYRDFIVDNYSLEAQLEKINKMIDELIISKKPVHQNILQEDGRLSIDYINSKMNEFISYDIEDFNRYDYSTAQIMLGKRERIIDGYELIEFILNNQQKGKLIFNNIWYDISKNKFILSEKMQKSTKSKEIIDLAKEIIDNKSEFQNDIAGFIFDQSMKEDVSKNYLAYIWERGIPASQFMPIIGYLKIAERYIFSASFINENHKVLEAPCGFGYGAAYLSKLCSQVEALDIAEDNIAFAKEAYTHQNIVWSKGDVTRLPYTNGEFDVYVSFEVFEHLPIEIVNKHIEEAYRVLKEDGKFIISTPNREMRKNVKNPFHVKEYNFDEVNEILKKVFPSVEFYSMTGLKLEKGMKETAYNMIAVCKK